MTLTPPSTIDGTATEIFPTVRDGGNGTYTVVYTPTELQVGTYTMTTTINGVVMPSATTPVVISRTRPDEPRTRASGRLRCS